VDSFVVIGAGPAGLAAAQELTQRGLRATVIEAAEVVGGLSRTVCHRGYRFDIGGHRFFTKSRAVQDFWEDLLGDDLLLRPRLSRIYYQGKFFDYPLDPVKTLLGLGPVEALRIVLSYLRAQMGRSTAEERTFDQWVTKRFGRRLFETFFKSYTEKVWGIPCSEIDAAWAAQRIRNLDVGVLLRNAILGSRVRSEGKIVVSLIERFHYPRLGPGQMWERCAERLAELGTETRLGMRVERVRHRDGRITSVVARAPDGAEVEFEADGFLSSMPIPDFIHALDPPPRKEVIRAADRLRYRDFVMVGLVIDRANVFPDNWIYVNTSEVKVGRIQNFKNWSPDMVPDPTKTSLGLEYFVQENDDLWCTPDEDLVELASRECEALGLIKRDEVMDGIVIRTPKAYPVYDGNYREVLVTIRAELAQFRNLEVIGRNGQHRYNNQDHAMLTGMLGARNLAEGSDHDIWAVNLEADYHEEIHAPAWAGSDRLVPRRIRPEAPKEWIRRAFARYDPAALAGAIGCVSGLGLFLATAVLLLRGSDPMGPTLSLLGNYFLGYTVTWPGAWLGLAEAGVLGAAFGWVLARLLNLVIGMEQRALESRIDTLGAMDPFNEGNR